tara:strand:- start:2013 stop:2396 length:384 start_codon:yes stop_codon:yes gene_type:complete
MEEVVIECSLHAIKGTFYLRRDFGPERDSYYKLTNYYLSITDTQEKLLSFDIDLFAGWISFTPCDKRTFYEMNHPCESILSTGYYAAIIKFYEIPVLTSKNVKARRLYSQVISLRDDSDGSEDQLFL